MIHMKTKFNVGDTVRVKSKKELIDTFGVTHKGYIIGNYGGWVKEMYDVCEKEGVVIRTMSEYGVEVQFYNGDSWNFSPSALEKVGVPVKQKDDCVHITFNGDTTTATDGKRTVSVKRYHDDEYDRNVAIAEVTKKLYHHFPEKGDVYYSVAVYPHGVCVNDFHYQGYLIDNKLMLSGNFYKNRATAEKVAASINKLLKEAKDYE